MPESMSELPTSSSACSSDQVPPRVAISSYSASIHRGSVSARVPSKSQRTAAGAGGSWCSSPAILPAAAPRPRIARPRPAGREGHRSARRHRCGCGGRGARVASVAARHRGARRQEGRDMLDDDQITQVPGREVYGPDGDKIGKAGRVFVDDHDRPAEVARACRPGCSAPTTPSSRSTARTSTASRRRPSPTAGSRVKGARRRSARATTSPSRTRRSWSVYGDRGRPARTSATGPRRPAGARRTATGSPTTTAPRDEDGGPGHDERDTSDDGAMTVSEEQLAVSTRSGATERRPAEQARRGGARSP